MLRTGYPDDFNELNNPSENGSSTSAIIASAAGIVEILVESNQDALFYKKFMQPRATKFKDCGGKYNVHAELTTQNNLGLNPPAAIGICDADFGRITTFGFYPPKIDNLFHTDCHDKELMILSNPYFWESFISYVDRQGYKRKPTYGGFTKANSLADAEAVLLFLLEAIRPLSYLRLIIANEKAAGKTVNIELRYFDQVKKEFVFLNYESFRVEKKAKVDTYFEIDESKMFDEISTFSSNHFSVSNYQSECKKVKNDPKSLSFDLFELSNGHDLEHILAIFCNIKFEDVKNMMNSFYSLLYFAQTNLYKELRDWQTTYKYFFLR